MRLVYTEMFGFGDDHATCTEMREIEWSSRVSYLLAFTPSTISTMALLKIRTLEQRRTRSGACFQGQSERQDKYCAAHRMTRCRTAIQPQERTAPAC